MMNKVQPIRDKQLVKDIYQYLLEQNSRDAVIYAVGIYTGLRISDILNLRVRDVRAKENITLYERKTGNGYLGAGKREDAVVRNKSGHKIKYKINRRPSQVKKLSKSGQYAAKKAEHAKSSVRAKVEHVFGVVKKQLHFRKTRYRGLEKQQAKFNIMFALANLILADRPCLAA